MGPLPCPALKRRLLAINRKQSESAAMQLEYSDQYSPLAYRSKPRQGRSVYSNPVTTGVFNPVGVTCSKTHPGNGRNPAVHGKPRVFLARIESLAFFLARIGSLNRKRPLDVAPASWSAPVLRRFGSKTAETAALQAHSVFGRFMESPAIPPFFGRALGASTANARSTSRQRPGVRRPSGALDPKRQRLPHCAPFGFRAVHGKPRNTPIFLAR